MLKTCRDGEPLVSGFMWRCLGDPGMEVSVWQSCGSVLGRFWAADGIEGGTPREDREGTGTGPEGIPTLKSGTGRTGKSGKREKGSRRRSGQPCLVLLEFSHMRPEECLNFRDGDATGDQSGCGEAGAGSGRSDGDSRRIAAGEQRGSSVTIRRVAGVRVHLEHQTAHTASLLRRPAKVGSSPSSHLCPACGWLSCRVWGSCHV